MKFALNLKLQMIQILTNNAQMLILCLSYFITTVPCITYIEIYNIDIDPKQVLLVFQCRGLAHSGQ